MDHEDICDGQGLAPSPRNGLWNQYILWACSRRTPHGYCLSSAQGRWFWAYWTTPVFLGFPGGSAGKESTCNAGELGLIPGLGRSPGEGKGYPLQYSGLENPMDCMCDHGVTKSRTQLSDFHFTDAETISRKRSIALELHGGSNHTWAQDIFLAINSTSVWHSHLTWLLRIQASTSGKRRSGKGPLWKGCSHKKLFCEMRSMKGFYRK